MLAVLVSFFVLQDIILPKQVSTKESFYEIEGYVVSKRLNNKIWIAKEPTHLIDRLTGHLFSNYNGLVIASKHSEAKNQDLFSHLKVNQKVRVYADDLLESHPAKTNAYYVELLRE